MKNSLPILLVSQISSEEIIINAFRAGVTDFYKKPFDYKKISSDIKKILGETKKQSNVNSAEPKKAGFVPMVGRAAKMRIISQYIERVAPMDTTVFITGETGTGKGLAAMLLHRGSLRSQQPFVSVNCAAIPDDLVESELFGYEKGAFTGAEKDKIGRFEMANKGTLFLDEIGDMGAYAQAKVLKVIEERENTRLGAKTSIAVDIRLIAATNVEPDELLSMRKFRKDLYYRINVARIHLPPLRERKEDIPRLVSHCIKSLNSKFQRNVQGVTDEAVNALLHYDWPGNVRELKNLLEGAFVVNRGTSIGLEDFPPFLAIESDSASGDRSERDNILSVLEATNWNKTMAASQMRCSRMTLYRKMAKYNLA